MVHLYSLFGADSVPNCVTRIRLEDAYPEDAKGGDPKYGVS